MKLRTAAPALLISALGCGPASPAAPATVVAITPPLPVAVAASSAPDPPRSLALAGGGWSMAQGDPARTGHVEARSIRAPRVLWKARVGVQGRLNAPVIAGSLVVVPSSGDAHNKADPRDGLHGIELATGRERWHARLAADADGVAVSGDRAIVGSDDGRVTAIDLQTGRELWSSQVQGKAYASPLPLGEQVIVGDASGTVRSLRLADGAPLWQVKLEGAIRGGASADEGAIYAVSQAGDAVALRFDGAPIWRARLDKAAPSSGPYEVYAAPLVAGSSLIIPFARDSYYATPAVIALDRRSGKLAWYAGGQGSSQWGNVRMTPALVSGALVWPEPYSGDIVGLDATTGAVRFRGTVGPCFFPSWAAPAAAGDVVYVPRFDGSLYAVRAGDGGVLWQIYLGEERYVGPLAPRKIREQTGCEWEVPSGAPLYAPPAIAEDGTVLVGSGEGLLYAIGEER
jgi:outer membrane protein assembly factor BamB